MLAPGMKHIDGKADAVQSCLSNGSDMFEEKTVGVVKNEGRKSARICRRESGLDEDLSARWASKSVWPKTSPENLPGH